MAKDGLTERLATRCSPAVKAALKVEMDRTGQSEGQVLEGIILDQLTGDPKAKALGALIKKLTEFISGEVWQTTSDKGWFDDAYKHRCLTSAISRLLGELEPGGTQTPSDILMNGLKKYNMESFADPEKVGGFAVSSLVRRWGNKTPNPAAPAGDMAYIKAMLKPETGGSE